ncbi:MAG: hypothetical protein ISR90_04875 [Candidatus Marinimicrobia bacterium]|nr:hypothetical protein [Candidatus Neomarinimicrobiota bacterium]MBL7023371.1 hypothetical protein [Candidatus Neomarinimicrobiota bacterium]MBL7109330.1 hypothetical protein [Candidatus Neomarinimicrobiota bacterium]
MRYSINKPQVSQKQKNIFSYILIILFGILLANCEFFTEPESNPPEYISQNYWLNVNGILKIEISEFIAESDIISSVEMIDDGDTSVCVVEIDDSIVTITATGLGSSNILIKIKADNQEHRIYLTVDVLSGYPVNLFMGEYFTLELSEISDTLPDYDSLSVVLDSLDNTVEVLSIGSDYINFMGISPFETTGEIQYFLVGELKDKSLLSFNCKIRKVVLGEMFTNDNCAGCVEGNHKVDEIIENKEESVAIIRYHLNWPDPNDPMYLYNVAENEARMYFYQDFFSDDAWALPNFIVGGVENPVSVETDWEFSVQSLIGGDASVYIGHEVEASGTDSILVTVQIYTQEQIVGSYDCYAVVVEDNYEHSGGNGENIHHQVMRDMEVKEDIAIDGNIEFSLKLLRPPGYSLENTNFHIVTFLQNSDKEVLQTNIDHPIIE